MLQPLSPRGLSNIQLSPASSEHWEMVVVEVPPGPLGILLDGTATSAAVLEGFAPVSADGNEKGAVELHGGVLPGSILLSVNEYEFADGNMSFQEIGQVLRETSHLARTMRFKVPLPAPLQAIEPPSSESSWSFAGMKSPSLKSPLTSGSGRNSPNDVSSNHESSSEPVPTEESEGNQETHTESMYVEETPVTPEPELVAVEAPPGPLGLNLDGSVVDKAVVIGFVDLRDGTKGALEQHGGIVPGSILVEINGEDVSHASLDDVRSKLGELSGETRYLVFQLPDPNAPMPRKSTISRAPQLPVFVEDLEKRRKLELQLILKYDKTKLMRKECWFLIDTQWMTNWVNFAARDGPLPGPINNGVLLEPEWRERLHGQVPGRPDVPREGLVVMKDYRGVSPMVWCLLSELHGSGEAPLLARYLLDIYAEAVGEIEVNAILKEPRLKATILGNDLRDKCLKRA